MARLNLEDSLLSSEEFRLYERKIGDPDKAIGSWVRAARMAQKYWIKGELIPYDIWTLHEISDLLIKYGLAEKRDECVYLKGSEKHFGWIRGKSNGGKKSKGGGRPSKNEELITTEKQDLTTENNGKQPLTLTPTLTPTQKEKKNAYGNTVKEIIDYFNDTTGKNYKSDAHETVRRIIALLKENYTIQDFKYVIDVKHSEWKNDPDMSKYIQPSTLFKKTKFDEYLNQVKVKTVEDCDNALLALFEGKNGN